MKLKTVIVIIAAFIVGFTASQVYASLESTFSETSYGDGYEFPADVYSGITGRAVERTSPGDHLSEERILVYKDRVVIDVKDAIFAKFTDTNSMDPIIDEGAHAIEVVPASEDEVGEGDIVAYRSTLADGVIIHRVIKKGSDQLGTYYILKGDNNPSADPEKVRFGQIKSVVVGIIY